MGFGESVSALLETYDNCLCLLKAFKRQKRQDGGRRVLKASDQQALLKHSLKADRRRVERAYSSRVAESGSRFEQGDSKARSALGRVLKRLNAVIAGLIRLASSDPAMDYQSLMSLSNSSRIQAIKAFDSLSHRLGSKSSQSSVASTSTSRSSKSSKSSRTSKSSRSRTSSSGSSSSRKDGKHRKRAKISKRSSHDDDRVIKADAKRQGTPPLPPRLKASVSTPLLDSMERRNEDSLLRRRPSMMNRFSLISISSGSTKLGEVPERKWGRNYDDDWDGGSDEYNVPIVYPLRQYQPVVKERRFLGLFRRGN